VIVATPSAASNRMSGMGGRYDRQG